MYRPSMVTRAAAILGASFILAACTGASKPASLPAGTYRYESTTGGSALQSAITVSRDSNAVVVHEESKFANLPAVAPVVTESRLDPSTYSVESYVVSNNPEGFDPPIQISPAAATYKVAGKPIVAKAKALGAPSWVLGDEGASMFAILPALVHATGAKTINVYYPGLARGKTLAQTYTVMPTTQSRPDGIPAGDAALGLGFDPKRAPVLSIWYDPATLVMSAVKIGDETDFIRKN